MPTGLGDEQLWISATNDNTGTSTAFDDQSGNSNNGTAVGALVVADTSSGGTYAFDFDGVSDYIDVPSSGVSAGAYSVSLWQRNTRSNNATTIAFNAGDGSNLRNVNVDAPRTGTAYDGYGHQRGSTYYFATNTTQRSKDIWYHAIVTYDGSTVRLYWDGVLIKTLGSVPNSDITESVCYIGKFIGGGYEFEGQLDDIRTYDRAITQSEVTHLSSQRGVEGTPPVGLGDEQLWLCPSLNDSANDISGSGNDGTYNGGMGTVLSDGKLAYDFDGLDDYIDTGSTTVHQNTVFTYSLWLKINSTVTSEGVMGSYEFSSGDRGPLLVTNAANSHGIWYYQSNGSQFNSLETLGSTLNVFDNTWRHVVCVFNGMNNTAKFYRDGVLLNEAVTNVPNTVNISTSFKIGAGASQYVAGLIDDARVYNRELTQAEVTHLASQRGVEGPAPVGLGDEKLWWVPTHSNSLFADSSSQGHSVTNEGTSPTLVADTDAGGQYAGQFATSGSVRVEDQFGFLSTGDFSMSGWIKSSTSARMVFGGQQAGGSDSTKSGGMIDQNSGVSRARFRSGSSDSTDLLTTASAVPNNTWHHVTATREGSDCKVHVNGVVVGTKTISGYPSSPDLKDLLIGGLWNGATPFNLSAGYMDDIRIYDRAITQAEITHLSSSRGVEGPPPVGLGTEKLWMSPTNSKNVNPFDDLSEVGNTMSVNGGLATVSNTDSGGTHAYDFDQTAAKAVLQSATENIDDTDSFAVSWWMNPSVLNSSTNYYIADCRSATGGGYNGWGLYLRNAGGGMKLGTAIYRGSRAGSSSGLQIGTPVSSMLNVWTQCAVNWDNTTSTWTLFVNGVNAGTYTPGVTGGPAVASGTHIAVGNYSPAPSSIYAPIALLDDFRVHNRVLTQAEVTHLASSRGIEGSPSTPTTQYNAFITHAFKQLFQQRLR